MPEVIPPPIERMTENNIPVPIRVNGSLYYVHPSVGVQLQTYLDRLCNYGVILLKQ